MSILFFSHIDCVLGSFSDARFHSCKKSRTSSASLLVRGTSTDAPSSVHNSLTASELLFSRDPTGFLYQRIIQSTFSRYIYLLPSTTRQIPPSVIPEMVRFIFPYAKPIDKDTYIELTKYCQALLSDTFVDIEPIRIVHDRYVPNQPLTLDLLCAWPTVTAGTFKGAKATESIAQRIMKGQFPFWNILPRLSSDGDKTLLKAIIKLFPGRGLVMVSKSDCPTIHIRILCTAIPGVAQSHSQVSDLSH